MAQTACPQFRKIRDTCKPNAQRLPPFLSALKIRDFSSCAGEAWHHGRLLSSCENTMPISAAPVFLADPPKEKRARAVCLFFQFPIICMGRFLNGFKQLEPMREVSRTTGQQRNGRDCRRQFRIELRLPLGVHGGYRVSGKLFPGTCFFGPVS